jgi:hypothetical protein
MADPKKMEEAIKSVLAGHESVIEQLSHPGPWERLADPYRIEKLNKRS